MSEHIVTVDGRPALTLARAAIRHGMTREALRKALSRPPLDRVRRYRVDERTDLYDLADLDEAMAARPRAGR